MLTIPTVDPKEVWGQSIRARLPGADEGAWLLEFENAVEEFCRDSLALSYAIPMELQAGVEKYPLNPIVYQTDPLDSEFSGVHALFVHYAEFASPPRRVRPRAAVSALAKTAVGPPAAIWVAEPAVVQVVPVPSSSVDLDAFTVATSLIPTRPIRDVPKMLADYYFEPLLDGTLGRMMSHPKRPYSDPKLGVYHMKRYRNGKRVAKDEALRRWGNAETSLVYNPDWSWKPELRHTL